MRAVLVLACAGSIGLATSDRQPAAAEVGGTSFRQPDPSMPAPQAGAAGDARVDQPPTAGPVPKLEPLATQANRPYRLLGRSYRPMTSLRPFRQRGAASWYGPGFQGRRTANGERYEMHSMTAAHPTLPLPSYAKVTNLKSGASVVVRVNDRGPFIAGRVIDVSHAAARRLGMLQEGTAAVEVDLIVPAAAAATGSPLAGLVDQH